MPKPSVYTVSGLLRPVTRSAGKVRNFARSRMRRLATAGLVTHFQRGQGLAATHFLGAPSFTLVSRPAARCAANVGKELVYGPSEKSHGNVADVDPNGVIFPQRRAQPWDFGCLPILSPQRGGHPAATPGAPPFRSRPVGAYDWL